MEHIKTSIAELVGHTPLFEPVGYEKKHDLKARILVKLEYFNPNQSVKDRTALSLVEDAEARGVLHPGDTIVEVTSGNTGIGLAAVAAAKGYKFKVYLQDNASKERFQVIRALGGEAHTVSENPVMVKALEESGGDFVAAVNAQRAALEGVEGVFFADQMSNPANPSVHERTTGPEIWEDTDGHVDILVAGVGTGGTVSGTGKYLKSKNPNIKVYSFQPGEGSLPSAENPEPEEISGVHPFEGMPPEQVPRTMDVNIYDENLKVETRDAYRAAREIARTDGILVGTSSGAALHAAMELAKKPENAGKTIVAIFPDTGLRYLSTNLFNDEYPV